VNGWLVFGLVASIVICCGFILAVQILRAAWAQREREALSASDLRAVEESAVLLVERLRSEADRAILELDERLDALQKLVQEADAKLQTLRQATTCNQRPKSHHLTPAPLGRQSESRVVEVSEKSPSICGSEIAACSDQPSGADAGAILDLASRGLTYSEIARRTGIDCAEVKLVLSLGRISGVS